MHYKLSLLTELGSNRGRCHVRLGSYTSCFLHYNISLLNWNLTDLYINLGIY